MTTVTVFVPLNTWQWDRRKAIVALDGALPARDEAQAGPIATRGDPAIVQVLARARRWRHTPEIGEFGTMHDPYDSQPDVGWTSLCRASWLFRGIAGEAWSKNRAHGPSSWCQ
jgi:hypothetical protein